MSIEALVDLWLTRGRRPDVATRAARDAVAHLTPAVVVTGGSRGIGAAIAREFHSSGRCVLIVARNAPPEPAGGTSLAHLVCDVTAADATTLIDAQLARRGWYCDVLVNNAAIGASGPFTQTDSPTLDALLSLNVAALTRVTRHYLPGFIARRRGGVLNIASLGAFVPGPHQAVYYASKSYVVAFTEAIASENAGMGVRFSILAPGPVDTSFHADMGAEDARYRVLLPALSAGRAARAAVRGYQRGQRLIVPGIVNQASWIALRVLPHALTVPLTRWLLGRSAN